MRRLTLLAGVIAVGLSGCGKEPAAIPAYRADTMITSIVFFDASRFAGQWYEVAAFRPGDAGPCSRAQSTYSQIAGGGLEVSGSSCAFEGRLQGTAAVTGPGRLTVTTAGQTETWWMLWVDEGYRTAVVGMPSGKLGFILNRDPEIPPDRLQAAREILDWNGYDLQRLVMIPQR